MPIENKNSKGDAGRLIIRTGSAFEDKPLFLYFRLPEDPPRAARSSDIEILPSGPDMASDYHSPTQK
jgi:hypothetical protein